MFSSFVFVAQYLQLVLGLSPLRAGLWTLPSTGGFIVGSMLAPLIVRRVRPAYVMGAGLAMAAVGFGVLTRVDGGAGLAVLVGGTVLISLGIAPVFTLGTDLVVGSAPPERAGAASAISETGAEFGGALGVAVLGSVGAAVYRRQVTDALPAEVPPEAATAARDTLGGAVAAAEEVPPQFGAALLDTARDAFTLGVQLTAGISAVLAVGSAVLVALLLRRIDGSAAPEEEPEPSQDGAVAGGVRVERVLESAAVAGE